MKDAKAALRYAKALLNLAIDYNMADEVNNNMLHISETIDQSKDLQVVLASPIIKLSAKKDVLLAIFKDDLNNITIGLINQLVDNKRLAILDSISKQYAIVYDFHKGTQIAKVTTAVPLTDELRSKILTKIKEIVGKEVHMESVVDPSIIGGFVLRVGDKQFDASIAGKMNKLRREFDDNLYVPNY